MPGTLHQGILEIFLEDPWLAFDLLGIPRPVEGCPIDRRGEIERDGREPFTVLQGYPDLVLVHRDATVPISPWLDEPARRPTAAVLVGALHGCAGNFEAARRAFQVTRTMEGRRRRRHGMTILAALPTEQRDQLIGELPMQEQHEWMDIERRSGTYEFGRREGRQEGLAQGRAVLRELIFGLLAERGLIVDAEAEAQICGCEDLATLHRWARRAMHAASTDELLEPA